MSSKRPGNKSPHPVRDDGDGASDPCDIDLDVDLDGIRADGLEGLQVGVRLTLRREPKDNYHSIVCVRGDGIVVGAIANIVKHTALLNCLARGVNYSVVVTEVRPGRCHVRGGRDLT